MPINLSGWKLELLTTWEAIEEAGFQKRWSELAENASNAHVFFHPTLVNIWLKTYRPLRDIQPLFVHAMNADQEVIFPLVLWRKGWKNAFLRVIVPAGHSDFDYHDPLFMQTATPEEVEGFYLALHQTLQKLNSYDRLLIDGLHENFLPSFAKVTHSEPCLEWVRKDTQIFNGFMLPLKKRLANDILRRLRRLCEVGNVHFHKFTLAEMTQAQDSLSKMLKEHAKRWPNAYKAPYFHHYLLEEGLRAGLVEFIECNLDGRPIAWRINFVYGTRCSLYMPAIDSNYLSYGPGNILLCFAIGDSLKSDFAVIDHLRGGEFYKSAWGGVETFIFDVVLDRKELICRLRIGIHEVLRKLRLKLM